MTREQIEKAATESCVIDNSIFNPKYVPYYEHGFIDGANWRINAVWHNGTVSCQPKRKTLVLFKNGNAAVYKDLRDLSFERLWGEVDKFAYLDDLLSDGKEVRS
jgi:hypothetical protein